jgi:hypothetical protein
MDRICLVGLVLLPSTALAEPSLDARVLALETQLRALTARVEVLERRGGEGEPAAQGDEGGIVWTLGAIVAGEPFRITHKQLDARGGRLDLLLEITAPLGEPMLWVDVGKAVPLAVTLRDADGVASVHRFTLTRGSSTEPGGRLHLTTEIDPARAAAARQVIIEPTQD